MTLFKNRPRTTARSFKVPKEPHLLASLVLRMPLISLFLCAGCVSGAAKSSRESGVCFGDFAGINGKKVKVSCETLPIL